MAVVQMQRINLVALKDDQQAIVKCLQELGVVELSMNFDKLRRKVRVSRTVRQGVAGASREANIGRRDKRRRKLDEPLHLLP